MKIRWNNSISLRVLIPTEEIWCSKAYNVHSHYLSSKSKRHVWHPNDLYIQSEIRLFHVSEATLQMKDESSEGL